MFAFFACACVSSRYYQTVNRCSVTNAPVTLHLNLIENKILVTSLCKRCECVCCVRFYVILNHATLSSHHCSAEFVLCCINHLLYSMNWVTQINLISLFSWIHCIAFEFWRKPPNKNKYSATDASPAIKLSTSTSQLILLWFHFVFTIQVITQFQLPSTLSHLECLNVLNVVIFLYSMLSVSFHVEQRVCWFLIFLFFRFCFCLCLNCIIPLICHSSCSSRVYYLS